MDIITGSHDGLMKNSTDIDGIESSVGTSSTNNDDSNGYYIHHHIAAFVKLTETLKSHATTGQQDSGTTITDSASQIEVLDDGSMLTESNIKEGMISIKRPIIVTDKPESIGMEVLKVSRKTNQSNRKRRRYSDGSQDDNQSVSSPTCDVMRKITNILGPSSEVNVIDVKTQKEIPGWTLGQLCDYFDDEKRLMAVHRIQDSIQLEKKQKEEQQKLQDNIGSTSPIVRSSRPRRQAATKGRNTYVNLTEGRRVFNQVSFEFSRSPLANYVQSPSFVREIDFIDIAWPTDFRYSNHGEYPAIQKYLLTSSSGSFMDFHIDFGGSSVWYHVLSGAKEFCLIEPTEEILLIYENWLCSDNQATTFLPDLILKDPDNNKKFQSSIMKVQLLEGQTMIIPSGWIHAVYTPVDTIVFGGNFLHSYDLRMQITVNNLEIRRQVLEKYRCPYFTATNIYASEVIYKKILLGQLTKIEIKEIPALIGELKIRWEEEIEKHTLQVLIDKFKEYDSKENDENNKSESPSNVFTAWYVNTNVFAAWYVTKKQNNFQDFNDFMSQLQNEYDRTMKDGIGANEEYVRRKMEDGTNKSKNNHSPKKENESCVEKGKTVNEKVVEDSNVNRNTQKVETDKKANRKIPAADSSSNKEVVHVLNLGNVESNNTISEVNSDNVSIPLKKPIIKQGRKKGAKTQLTKKLVVKDNATQSDFSVLPKSDTLSMHDRLFVGDTADGKKLCIKLCINGQNTTSYEELAKTISDDEKDERNNDAVATTLSKDDSGVFDVSTITEADRNISSNKGTDDNLVHQLSSRTEKTKRSEAKPKSIRVEGIRRSTRTQALKGIESIG